MLGVSGLQLLLLIGTSCHTHRPFVVHASSNIPQYHQHHDKQRQLQNQVCFEGFIMDTYCIGLGFLLDASSFKTLEQPEKHSVHCLVDVGVCVSSGFQVLSDPVQGSNDKYGQSCILDDTGNEMILELARTIGTCSTCYKDKGGTQQKGLRATVIGTLDPDSSGSSPPRLLVSEVLPSSVGCATANTLTPTAPPTTESPTKAPATQQPTPPPPPTASPTAIATPVPTISTKSPTPSPSTQQPTTPPPTTASPTAVVAPVPTVSIKSPAPSPSTQQLTTPPPTTASPTAVVTPVPTISTKSPTSSPSTRQPTITSPDPTESTAPTTAMTTSVPTNTIISAGASCQPAPTNPLCTLIMVSLLVIGGGWIGM